MSGLAKFFQAPSDADTPEDANPYTQSLVETISSSSDDVDQSEPLVAHQVWREDWQNRKQEIIYFFGARMLVQEPDTEEPRVPPASKAFIDTMNLAQLNLQTRSLQLDLCRVERFWQWRKNSRGKKYPLFPHHLQDDGMLAVVYKGGVVSVELLVFDTEEPSATREHAQRLHKIQDYKRLHVFFYFAYAAQIAELLKKKTKRSSVEVFLSLSGIPALCLVPHERHSCWYGQQETSPFSVCIGDSSLMDSEAPNKRTLRFDESKDLCIQVLKVQDKNMECFQLEPHKTDGVKVEQLDDCSLKKTYIAHMLGNKKVSKGTKQGETSALTIDEQNVKEGTKPNDNEGTAATAEVVMETGKRSAPEVRQDPMMEANKRRRVLREGCKTLVRAFFLTFLHPLTPQISFY